VNSFLDPDKAKFFRYCRATHIYKQTFFTYAADISAIWHDCRIEPIPTARQERERRRLGIAAIHRETADPPKLGRQYETYQPLVHYWA
jgi:hypothetical protein